MSAVWSLTGGKRTWRLRRPTSQFDPKRTSALFLRHWLASYFRIRSRPLAGTIATSPACFATTYILMRFHVEIRAGYEIAFQCFQETPMVLMLSVEPAREKDLLSEHRIQFSPNIPSRNYVDMFGNSCTRIVAPAGLVEMRNDFLIADDGLPDEVAPEARQLEVGE